MIDNHQVILPKPPLESKLPTFEDDPQSSHDNLDPCHLVHKADLSMGRNDIQVVKIFAQNHKGDKEAIYPFTHAPSINDEYKENLIMIPILIMMKKVRRLVLPIEMTMKKESRQSPKCLKSFVMTIASLVPRVIFPRLS